MSAWEDRPPLTRREARERERQAALSVVPDPAPSTPEPASSTPDVAPADPAPAAVAPEAQPEHTLTRRELRALRAAREANQPAEASPAQLAEDSRPAENSAPRSAPRAFHWSRSSEDEAEVGSTSGTSTASNALILPSVPSVPTTGPLTSTGDILVTGSIDLPRSLGATGQHPSRYDSPDIDRLFDAEDADSDDRDSAPVRASSAVSSHASARDTITPPKARKGRLTVALIVTASILAAGVIALVVATYAMRIF